MFAAEIRSALFKHIDVFDETEFGSCFRDCSSQKIRGDDGVFGLDLRVPAIHFVRALVIEHIELLAEDAHVAHNCEQNAVFEVYFGCFPKRQFEFVEKIGCFGRAFGAKKLHRLKFVFKSTENDFALFINKVFRCGNRTSLFRYKFAVFSHKKSPFNGFIIFI